MGEVPWVPDMWLELGKGNSLQLWAKSLDKGEREGNIEVWMIISLD